MKKSQSFWRLILVGSIPIVVIVLGDSFDFPSRFTIPVVVVAALIFSSMALWMHANTNATGDEWWQDNSSSGWRGY